MNAPLHCVGDNDLPIWKIQSIANFTLPTWANASSLSSPPDRRKGPYTFTIAGTQTVLIIYAYPIDTIDPRPVITFFANALEFVRTRTRAERPDTQLTSSDDPFAYEYMASPELGGASCRILVESWKDEATGVPQHLTYRVLRDVLGGLRDFVFEMEMYLGLSFDVGDEIRGKLGEGILRPGLAPRVFECGGFGCGGFWFC